MRLSRPAALTAGRILLAGATTQAAAQTDYRNLDDDRPSAVEDAYPIERYSFELLVPYRFERERDGVTVHAWVPELAYGLFPNAQVGLKMPVAAVRESSGTESGLSGLRLFALYNLCTEARTFPALSVRGDVTFPVGELSDDETRLSLKLIATRSFGRNRLHINAAYLVGPDGRPAAVESAHRWWYGVALDRTLYRQSLLLVGSVHALRPVDGSTVEVNTTVGLRWQWTPTLVLDGGVERRLRGDVGPDYALTAGLSHAFAIAGLVPVRR